MAGSLGLPVGLENVMHSLTKENCLESWEVMSHVQSDTTNVFIKFQKKTTRALPLVINDRTSGENPDQEEELTTTNFGNELHKKYAEFRELGLFTDLTLKVEDKSFKVHKIVLASCSDYFRAIFSHDMIESKSNQLDLSAIPSSGIEPLLNYAYSGNLKLSLRTIGDVLATSSFLQFTGAVDLCEEYMKSKMTFDNADILVTLADRFALPGVKKYHRRFLLDNFLEFAETQTFLNLDHKTLISYMSDDSLRTPTEGRLFKKAMRWYNHDKKAREKYVHLVLDTVRYTQEGWPLIEYAEAMEPFISNKKCKEMVSFWHNYMRNPQRGYLVQSHRTRVRYDRKTLVLLGGLTRGEFAGEVWGDDICANTRSKFYHRDLGQWLPLGVLDRGFIRSSGVMLEVNDFGVIIGGETYQAEDDFQELEASDEVKLLNPSGPHFSLWDLPCLLEPRTKHAAAAVPGFVYVIGGCNDKGMLRTVEQYNMEKERWTHVKKLDQPVQCHAAAAHIEMIYISGGTEKTQITNRVQCYDHKHNVWVEKPALHAARHGHTMSRVGHQLIVCGGAGRVPIDGPSAPRYLSSVESFCLETEQWTYLSPMRFEAYSPTATVFEGKLLVCGGVNVMNELQLFIQQFDPQTERWSLFGQLPFPLRDASICALTVKLTEGGKEETDSIRDEYDDRYGPMYDDECGGSDDLEDELSGDDQFVLG